MTNTEVHTDLKENVTGNSTFRMKLEMNQMISTMIMKATSKRVSY